MVITFLLPGPSTVPAGGYKIIYEYANRLAQDGHSVHIAYAGSLFWKKKSLRFKITNIIRYFQKLCSGFSAKGWFSLHRDINEHLTMSLNYNHVPKSDIYIGSSPHTAIYLNNYPVENSRKFYFIQDYENWGNITDELLRETYRFKFLKLVVSNWLGRIMDEEGVRYKIIPNGFDFKYFYLSKPVEQRKPSNVAMVYSPIARKGFAHGMKALEIVKQHYPELHVDMFGTDLPPEEFPDWISFTQCPDKQKINEIYNNASIFVGPSIQEGWGLTVGEAMQCGAAVACTDNLGYKEMAADGKTALLSPVGNPEALAENILKLICDDALRHRIASEGHKFIQDFSIDNSYRLFKSALNLA